MATVYPLNREYKITPFDDGNILSLGNGEGRGGRVSMWSIQFAVSPDFVGEIGVLGRVTASPVHPANTPEAAFVSFPYRLLEQSGVAMDGSLQAGNVLITVESLIMVPSYGMDVGLLVGCSAGSCWVYSQDCIGTSTP